MKTIQQTLTIERGRADKSARVVQASVSSETPIDHGWGGKVVLVHKPEAVDLGRVPLPVIVSHSNTDLPVGVAENFRFDRGRLCCQLRFGTSARAEEAWNDVEAGILRNLSIGADVHETEKRGDQFYITRWEPMEVSLCSVPADRTIGIGRTINHTHGETAMDVIKTTDPATLERERVTQILELSRAHADYVPSEMADQAVAQGWKVDRFCRAILAKSAEGSTDFHVPAVEHADMMRARSAGRLHEYSLVRAINAACEGDWSKAGYEREVHEELQRQRGKRSSNLMVPYGAMLTRGLTTGGATSGATLVPTEHLESQFIEALRTQSLVMTAGATVLSGLRGDVVVPKQTGASTAYWLAEDAAITPADPSFGAVTLAPKSVGALSYFSRKLMLQASPDVEMLVRRDLAAVIAQAIDVAALAGTGADNQPEGILVASGIGSVSGGAAPTWADIVDLETAVAVDDAEGKRMAYMLPANVRGSLKQTDKGTDTGAFCWEGGEYPLNGYKAYVSNNLVNAIIFGDWSSLLVGIWGSGIEVEVDPYTAFNKGGVYVRCMADCDIALRHPEAFAAQSGIVIA